LGHQRDLIERVLGSKVYDYYCSREAGPIAHQCDQREGLHLADELLHVEIKPDEMASQEGSGELLVTDLANFGMPFIRYRIGDRARLVQGDCACGRGLQRLDQVIGRATDFLLSTRGELLHGAAIVHYVLALGYDVGQVQFIQRRPGHVVVRLKYGYEGRRAELDHLERTLRLLLGSEVHIEYEFVTAILPERSGKYRVTISEIPLTGAETKTSEAALSVEEAQA
jgi:phenylacetate-CoA ligase